MSKIRMETNRQRRLWRQVLLVLVSLPLLAGPAVALLPVTAEEGIRLEVPAIPQRFNGTAGDFNCLPASLAMALQTVDPIGLSDTDRYIEVRSNLRQLQPNLLKGLGFADAVQRVPELTDHRWSVVDRGTDAQHWRQFLLDQFRQGRPVIAYINDAMRLEPAWRFPGSHAIVITGLEAGQVWYNDPWDGREHAMSEEYFASAWGNTRLPDGKPNDGGAWYSLVFARPQETVAPTLTQTPIPTPRPAATIVPVPTTRSTDAPAIPPTIAPVATIPVSDVAAVPTAVSADQPIQLNVDAVIEQTLQAIVNAGTYRYDLYRLDGTLDRTVEVNQATHRARTLLPDGSLFWVCADGVSYNEPLVFKEQLPCDQVSTMNPFYEWFVDPLQDPNVHWTLQAPEFMNGKIVFPLEWLTFEGDPPMVRVVWVDSETMLPVKAFVRSPVEGDYIEQELLFAGWGLPLDIQLPAEQEIEVPPIESDTSQSARVTIEVWTCGEGESSMTAWGADTVVDWGILCLGIDAPQTLIFSTAGEDVAEIHYPQTAELWLPFGEYTVTNLTLGLQTTLSMAPNDYCQGTSYCDIGWTVGIQVEEGAPSVSVTLYQCPADVGPAAASADTCSIGGTGSLDLYFWNPRTDQYAQQLQDAAFDGQTYSWTGVPYGTYILAPEWGPGLFGSIYVPGLESFDEGSATVDWDDTTFPASPDYTVTPLSGTGYWVPVLPERPAVSLDVYAFGPNCLDAVCEDSSTITSSQGTSQISEDVSSNDPLLAHAIEWFGGEWTGIFYQSNPTMEWPIEVSYWGGAEGEVVGSIAYLPDLCSGDLVQLPMVLDFGLALREEITTGKENCLSGGLINLERNGDELTFTWSHPDSKAVGHGRLQRTGSSQPLTIGAGSLEVHLAACPIGYTGQNFDDDCHSNGIADATVTISGPTLMALPLVTEIDAESGTGVASAEALDPGDYMLSRSAYEDSLSFLYCSPDRGQTTLVSTYVDPYQVATVPIYDQAVVCDWFFLP